MSEFHPDDQYIYLGYINGSHKVRNQRTGKTYNADKITTGGIPLSSVVKFLGKKIDSKPYRKTETPDNPGYSFIGEVVAISPYPITKPDDDPENLARVGGHIPSPLKTIANTDRPKVSKTGKNKNEWISGNQFGNYYWDKETKEFKTFSFYPEVIVNAWDKLPYNLTWIGYGFLFGIYRKIPPITETNTTVVSKLTTTSTKREECQADLIVINLNSKVRYTGTFFEELITTFTKPGDPDYDPGDPYANPPPSCTPVCVPAGPAVSGIADSADYYYKYTAGDSGNFFTALQIAPFTDNPTKSQIQSAYTAKYGQYGAVSVEFTYSFIEASRGDSGERKTIYEFKAKYKSPYSFVPKNCVCNPDPPPPPPPPNVPPPPVAPNPPGAKSTEKYTLDILINNIAMKTGVLKPYKWYEYYYKEMTDNDVTLKQDKRIIDMWIPLVKNEKGDAVIVMNIFQNTTVANPPDPSIAYYYYGVGSTTPVSLNSAIFQPIFFKSIAIKTGAKIVREDNPLPDLITLEGKDPYLARVVYPDLDDPEAKQPDVKDVIMDLEMWAIPSGTKTTKKVKVKSLKIVEDGAIPHYSYYPKSL